MTERPGLFDAATALLAAWTETESPAIADMFDDLANHGRFDDEGGYLSQDDWDDARSR